MAKMAVDKYANQLIATVVESGANTLTFEQLPQLTSLLEKKAYLINRVQYFISGLTELKADGETVRFGLSLSSQFNSPSLNEVSILDMNRWYTHVVSAVGFEILQDPFIKDFSTLPGGGILVPTRPLYLFVQGVSLAAAMTVIMRMYFTIIELTPADYWDLVEAVSPIT